MADDRTLKPAEASELRFLEALRLRLPDDELVLKALGDLYTRGGRFEDGYAVDLELVRMLPEEDMVWYNLACSHALLGHLDQAFEALEQAVEHGYDDLEHLQKDGDLAALRGDPRYAELMDRITTP